MELNLASLVGIGGPVGILSLVMGFILKTYLTKRVEDRADEKTERESESGIVETTSKALQIVRAQMVEFGEDLKQKDMRIRTLSLLANELQDRVSGLQLRVSELEYENQVLRARGT